MTAHSHSTTANKTVRGVQFTVGADPANTEDLAEDFFKELFKRAKRLRGLVRQTVGYQNDALLLKEDAQPPGIISNADDVEVFDFPTVEGRKREFIRQFREWADELFQTDISFVDVREGEHFTAEFLQDAYVQGVQNAQGRLMQGGVSLQASTPEDILSRPQSVRQLQQIYSRAFENLRNITEDMANQIRIALTEAIARGENPRKVASRLNKEIEDITRTRLLALARTEIIESNATATLDEYERVPPDIGVRHGSFMTAMDTDVCPFCRRISDHVLTIDEMRSVASRFRGTVYRAKPAAHPNCRCSIAPEISPPDDLAPIDDRVPGDVIAR